ARFEPTPNSNGSSIRATSWRSARRSTTAPRPTRSTPSSSEIGMQDTQAIPFSPIALVGTITLLAAYLTAAWAFAAGIAGNARKSRRLVNASVYGLYGFAALVALSATLMIYAFVTHDFAIK